MGNPLPTIQKPSIQSLYVEAVRVRADGGAPVTLTTGTAFVVTHGGSNFLVTNWHVLTGRTPGSNEPIGDSAAMPSHLVVHHIQRGTMGRWKQLTYPLYDVKGEPLWRIHSVHGSRYDIVAVALPPDPRIELLPYGLVDPNVGLSPTTEVSIVGFPFGIRTAGGVAVWSRGTIASEPELDYDDRPAFLIDSRTRPGQSGSPVIFHSEQVPSPGGGFAIYSGSRTFLLGIYSGRISAESDLGIVWRTGAVREVVTVGVRDSLEFF